MLTLDTLNNLPEISFVDTTLDELLANMISEYETAYYNQTGQVIKLYPGDPVRIFIYTQALRIYQAHLMIDFAGKQNFLRYATDPYLDHMAATRASVIRLEDKKALVTMLFILSTTFGEAKIIPANTRVSAGDNTFFINTENFEVAAGELTASAIFECIEAGTAGNGYVEGQINTLVDPISYVASVENTTVSQGGAEIESNDNLRLRTFLAPESFAVAGPELAYVAMVKNVNQSIIDVSVGSPNPGEVDIRFILTDGEIPDATIIAEVLEACSDRYKRPLTDNVSVDAPDQVDYDIELTYYIDQKYSTLASQIQTNVNNAIDSYISWQKTVIGRDVNPSELHKLIMQAGAKRVEITTPIFAALAYTEVANLNTSSITYGGIEVG